LKAQKSILYDKSTFGVHGHRTGALYYFTDVIADSSVRCKRGVTRAIEEPCSVGVILVG
jgi:hypothetical protein